MPIGKAFFSRFRNLHARKSFIFKLKGEGVFILSKWSNNNNQCKCPCCHPTKETVEAVFILDESGSMFNQQSKVVSGFNENLQDMRRDNSVNYRVTLIKFASDVTLVYQSVPIENVKDLTFSDYMPNGSTALLDAVGDAINMFSSLEKVMLHVFTDGEENCSRRFQYSQIKELLDSRQRVNHWAAIFLGANVDAWSQGAMLGVAANNSINYNGVTTQAFSAASYARSMYTSNLNKASVQGWDSVDNDNLLVGFDKSAD